MKGKALKKIQIIVSLLILVLLIVQFNVSDFSQLHFSFDVTTAFLLLAFLFLSLFTRSIRWSYLMNNGETKISQWNSFKFLLVGSALNIIMPAGAGDVAKSYFGYRWTGIKERMFSVSLYDKLVAIASLSVLSVYATIVTKNYFILLAGALSLLPLVIVRYHKHIFRIPLFSKALTFIDAKIKKVSITEILENLIISRKKTIVAFIWSACSWVITYFLMYKCFQLLNLNISLQTVIAMSPILTLARLFPFTFNGLGSDELLIVLLFSNSEVSDESVIASAIIFRILILIIPAIFGSIIIHLGLKQNSSQLKEL